MSFQYGCFISCCDLQNELFNRTMAQLSQRLSHELAKQLTISKERLIYLDKTRQEDTPAEPAAIAKALCQSACMLVIYTPNYFQNRACAQEYKAMEQLEQQRLSLLQRYNPVDATNIKAQGLIRPIILRGSSSFPDALKKSRTYFVLEDVTTEGIDRYPIQDIARFITNSVQALSRISEEHSPFQSCDDFQFPEETVVQEWLDTMKVLPKPSFLRNF